MRKIAVTALGGLIVVVGAALVVLPGPGALVIVLGLAVLAEEYPWARRRLDAVRGRVIVAAEASVAGPWRLSASLLSAAAVICGGVLWGVVDELPMSSWWTAATVIAGGLLAGATVIWAAVMRRRDRRAARVA
jgi:Putative transmembrane protein (PGPGW)